MPDVACLSENDLFGMKASYGGAPRKISAYGMMIGVHGRGTARLFDPRRLIEAV
jgi:hypothetical protein